MVDQQEGGAPAPTENKPTKLHSVLGCVTVLVVILVCGGLVTGLINRSAKKQQEQQLVGEMARADLLNEMKRTTVKRPIFGSPKLEKTGTSRVERANLTLRMSQRRWTRRTNAHSKSYTHMMCSFAIFLCHYNWVRVHATHGTTPALRLGVAGRPWDWEDLIGLLEEDEGN